MRKLIIVLMCLAGCSKSGSLVFVTVDAAAPLATATRLHVTLVDGSTHTSDITLSPAGFPPAHSFAVDVGAGVGGTMSVAVEAFDANSQSLGSSSGSVAIAAGKRVDLSLTIGGVSPPDMSMPDLTGTPPPDMTGAPDMTGPPPDMAYSTLTWVTQKLNIQFFALWAADPTHIWLGAEDTASNYYSTGNDVWTQVSANPFFGSGGLWGTDASHVFLVDDAGDIRTWLPATTAWDQTGHPVASGNPALTAIWGTSLTDMYAVGSSLGGTAEELIYHNTTGTFSSGWTNPWSVLQGSLYGVSGAPGQVYAVGAGGRILHTSDGTTWNNLTSSVATGTLRGIFALDAQHIYVVGDAGTVLFSGGNGLFARQTIPSIYSTYELRAVWAADPNNVFVVGDKGAIIHGDAAGNWVVQTSGLEVDTVNLNAVWGTSARNVYAAGDGWVAHGQ